MRTSPLPWFNVVVVVVVFTLISRRMRTSCPGIVFLTRSTWNFHASQPSLLLLLLFEALWPDCGPLSLSSNHPVSSPPPRGRQADNESTPPSYLVVGFLPLHDPLEKQIDFSKIESRPTSAQLLQYLRFQQSAEGGGAFPSTSNGGGTTGKNGEERRFQYCFYLVRALLKSLGLVLAHLFFVFTASR